MHAVARRILNCAEILASVGLVLAASWSFIAWMALNMAHPLIELMLLVEMMLTAATPMPQHSMEWNTETWRPPGQRHVQ